MKTKDPRFTPGPGNLKKSWVDWFKQVLRLNSIEILLYVICSLLTLLELLIDFEGFCLIVADGFGGTSVFTFLRIWASFKLDPRHWISSPWSFPRYVSAWIFRCRSSGSLPRRSGWTTRRPRPPATRPRRWSRGGSSPRHWAATVADYPLQE